jgi:NAD+ synthase
MSDRATHLAAWLHDRMHAAGARGFVVGLSGGIDSAVVARLCQLAVHSHILGVLLPCYSQPQDEADALLVAKTFGIPTVRIDLARPYDALQESLHAAIKGLPHEVHVVDIKQQLPEANIKPRLRMTTLYFIANSLNYLVAGTGNRSEIALGYYTKYGDGGVDLLPIGGLLKSEVRTLARDLGVPASVITKPPSAGLWIGQTDEAEMGFSYEALEQYLAHGRTAVPARVADRIEALQASSDHKRALPPIAPL